MRPEGEHKPVKLPVKLTAEFQLSIGAGEGNRTLVCSLGSCRSAIELRPRTPIFQFFHFSSGLVPTRCDAFLHRALSGWRIAKSPGESHTGPRTVCVDR